MLCVFSQCIGSLQHLYSFLCSGRLTKLHLEYLTKYKMGGSERRVQTSSQGEGQPALQLSVFTQRWAEQNAVFTEHSKC